MYRNYIDEEKYDNPETLDVDERFVDYIDDPTCYDVPYYIEQYGDLEMSREIMLMAVWLKNTYNIEFNLNDVTDNNGSTEAELVAPTNDANFDINELFIKFDENNYYLKDRVAGVDYIDNIVVDRYGYTFLGWSFNITTSKEVYYRVEAGTTLDENETYYYLDDSSMNYFVYTPTADDVDVNGYLKENVRIFTKSNTIYEAMYAYDRIAGKTDSPFMLFNVYNYIKKYINETNEHHMTIRLFATWKANEYRFNYIYNAPLTSDLSLDGSYANWSDTSPMTTNSTYPNLSQIIGSSPSSQIYGTQRIIFDEELKASNVSREGYIFIGYSLGTDLNNCAIFTKDLYEDKTTIRLNNSTAIVDGIVYLYNNDDNYNPADFVEVLGREDCDDYYINLYALWQPIVYSVTIEANTENGSTHAYFYDNTDPDASNHQFITSNINTIIDLSVQFDTDDWVYTYTDDDATLHYLREIIIGRLGYTWTNFYLTKDCAANQNVLEITLEDGGNIVKTEKVFNYVMFNILYNAGNINSTLGTLSIFNGWSNNTYDVVINNNEIGDTTSLARFSDSDYSEEYNTNTNPITVTFDNSNWNNMLDDTSVNRMDRYGYTWNYLWPQTSDNYGYIKNNVTVFDYELFRYLFNSENLDDECSILNTFGNRTEITVYAHWIANTYKIVVKYNDSRDNAGSSKAYTYNEEETITGDQEIYRVFGEELSLEPLKRLGYNFKGWIIGDDTGLFLTTSTEALGETGINFEDYLISKYNNILNYTYLKTISTTFAGCLTTGDLPVYYSKAGVNYQETFGDDENAERDENRLIYIYAFYTKKIYTIIFDANDISSATGIGTTYAFHNRVTESGSTGYLQGVPTETVNSIYKIKFDTDDWQNLDKLFVSRNGYIFNGWYARPTSGADVWTDTEYDENQLRLVNRTSTIEGTQKVVEFTETVYNLLKKEGIKDDDSDQRITLYAGWIARVYNIAYNTGYYPTNENEEAEKAFENGAMGGDEELNALKQITFDTEVTLPTLSKPGFDFVGWSFNSVSYYSDIENPLGYFISDLAIIAKFDGVKEYSPFNVKFGNYSYSANETTNVINLLINNKDKNLITFNGSFYLYKEKATESTRVVEQLGSEAEEGAVYLYAVWKPRTFNIILEFNDVTSGFGSTEAILTNGNWLSGDVSYVANSTVSHVYEKNYAGAVEYNQKYKEYYYYDEESEKNVYAFEFVITLYTPFNDLSYDKNVSTNFLIDRYGYTWTGWHFKSSVDKNTHLVVDYNRTEIQANSILNTSIDYYEFDGNTYTYYNYLDNLDDFEVIEDTGELKFKSSKTLYTPFISPRQDTNVVLTIDHIQKYEQYMKDNDLNSEEEEDILRLVAGWNVNEYQISYVNNAVNGSSTVYQIDTETSNTAQGLYNRITTPQTTLKFDDTAKFFFYRIGYTYHGYSFVNYSKFSDEHASYYSYYYNASSESYEILLDGNNNKVETVWYYGNNKTLTLNKDYVESRQTSRVYLYTGPTSPQDLNAEVPFEVLGDNETQHHIVIYVFWRVQEFEFNIALNTQNLYNFNSEDAGYRMQLGASYNMDKDSVEAYATDGNSEVIITFKMPFDTKFVDNATTTSLGETYNLNQIILYATGYDFTSLGVAPEDGEFNTLIFTYNKSSGGITNDSIRLDASLFDLLYRFNYSKTPPNSKLTEKVVITTSNIKIDTSASLTEFSLYAYYTIKKYTVEVKNNLKNASDPKNGVYKLFNYNTETSSMLASATQSNLTFFTTEYVAILPISDGHYLSKLTIQLTGDDGIKKYLILDIAYDQTVEDKILKFTIYKYGEDLENLEGDTLSTPIYNLVKAGASYNSLTKYYTYHEASNTYNPYSYLSADWVDGKLKEDVNIYERASVLSIPDNVSGSTQLLKYLFNQLSLTTIMPEQTQTSSGYQFFENYPEDEEGELKTTTTKVMYPSTYPENVVYSYLKFKNIKANIQIYCEYNIQKFNVEIQNEIIIDGLVDNSIPNEEPKEYKYGTLISSITTAHEQKMDTTNGALQLKGWYYKYSEDGEEYEITDDGMKVTRDLILICKYEKSAGKPTRKIVFYVWDKKNSQYMIYDTGSEYVFQGIVSKYSNFTGTITTEYVGFTYTVLPSNNDITIWTWTDYDNIPYFEFKINEDSEYWIPSNTISTAYGGEFNGLVSEIKNGIVYWYYCSEKPTEDNYSTFTKSQYLITQTTLTFNAVEAGIKYVDTTAYYTYNGSNYISYTLNENDWIGFVKDSITLYTISGASTVSVGSTYNGSLIYYKLVDGAYKFYNYNPDDWTDGTLNSGVTLYTLSELNGTLVSAGTKYNSATKYYTYKDGIFAEYTYREKDWSGLVSGSNVYIASGNDVLYVKPTRVPSIGEAYPGSQIIGFGIFDPALTEFKLLANLYKGYLYGIDSTLYSKYYNEYTTYYNKLDSDYSHYKDIFADALTRVIDTQTDKKLAENYLLLEKFTISDLMKEHAYLNVYNLTEVAAENKTYVDIEFIAAAGHTSILNGIKIRNVELISTSTNIDECLYALQTYAAFSFTISDYSKKTHFSLSGDTVIIDENYLDTISYYEIVAGNVDYYQKSEVRTVVLTREQFNTYSHMIADGTPPATALQEIIKKYNLSPKKSFWDDGSIVYADIDLEDDSYLFMFFYKNGSTSSIITTCDTYVYRNGNTLEYYLLTNNFSFRLNAITVKETSIPNTAQVTLIKNNMNTSYTSGSYVLGENIVGGEKYTTNNLFFVLLSSSQIKTLISSEDKEETLRQMFIDNNWQVRNNNTSFTCEGMAFVVAYFADINGNILKVAANYASIDANGETPTRSIIYMQELMFTSNTELNLSDTTLELNDIDVDTMLTDAYDFNNGIALDKDTQELDFVVFNGSTFKMIADYVMNELYTWNKALSAFKTRGTNLRSGSIDITSGVYYVVPVYNYEVESTPTSYFGANFIKIVDGTSYTVETLSNNLGFTITSIESQYDGPNETINLKFNRDYLNDTYFDYELNGVLPFKMGIVSLTTDEFNVLIDYYTALRGTDISSIIVKYGSDELKLSQFTFEQTLEFILYYYRVEQMIANSSNADEKQANQSLLDQLKIAMFDVLPNDAVKEDGYYVLTGEMFDEAVKLATVNQIVTSDTYAISSTTASSGMYIGVMINEKNIDKVSMNYVYYTHSENATSIDTTILKTYASFI